MKKILVLIICIIFVAGCAETMQRTNEQRPDVVWPLPPDKPRIKWIRYYNNTYDVEDPPGFIDKIAGTDFFFTSLPQGVVADREGNVYVADSVRSMVVVFKPSKKKLTFVGQTDMNNRPNVPIGLAISYKNNMILVANSGSKKVIGYDLGTDRTKLILGGFGRPVSVAVDDARDRFYVSDSKNSEIKAFDMTGKYLFTVAKKGAADNQVVVPDQVALDKHGNIYVADTFNFRVKVFSPEGNFLKSIGQGPCTGMGCFSKVNGVAIDSDDNIYAVDTDFGNVQIFNQKGELLLIFGGYGSGWGQLQLPMHIYIDEKDRLYVADSNGSKISVYQYIKYDEK